MSQKPRIIFCLALLLTALAIIPVRGDEPIQSQLWQMLLGQSIDTSPAIGSDGTLYVTACGYVNFADISGGKLAAITPQGNLKWLFKTSSDIKSSPALGSDGTIYFGSRDRNLYAVAHDGKKIWAFATGAWVDASPAIANRRHNLFWRVGSNLLCAESGRDEEMGADHRRAD